MLRIEDCMIYVVLYIQQFRLSGGAKRTNRQIIPNIKLAPQPDIEASFKFKYVETIKYKVNEFSN